MRKEFDQSKDNSQISFENVIRNYNNAPLNIVQIYSQNQWIDVNMVATKQNVWYYAMGGATKFQFHVCDEFDEIHYPDYSLHELLK